MSILYLYAVNGRNNQNHPKRSYALSIIATLSHFHQRFLEQYLPFSKNVKDTPSMVNGSFQELLSHVTIITRGMY